jgi:hypothetical protein
MRYVDRKYVVSARSTRERMERGHPREKERRWSWRVLGGLGGGLEM